MQRDLRDSVRIALDKVHGRRSVVRTCDLLKIEDLARACHALNILNHPTYEGAYAQSALPFGAPSNIAQSYGVRWSHFFELVKGMGRTD